MNITAKIAELNQEILKLSVAKQTAHDRIIELRVQIKKLTTLAKHAEDVFSEKDYEDSSRRDLHENLEKTEENGQGELTGV